MSFEAINLYAKHWFKTEQVDLRHVSERKACLEELVREHISNLKGHFQSPKCKVLNQPDGKDTFHKLPTNYVLVPADKTANNVIVVSKKYYIDTPVEELGINNPNSNSHMYVPTLTGDTYETILKSHNQFMTSVGSEMSQQDQIYHICTGIPSCIKHHTSIDL